MSHQIHLPNNSCLHRNICRMYNYCRYHELKNSWSLTGMGFPKCASLIKNKYRITLGAFPLKISSNISWEITNWFHFVTRQNLYSKMMFFLRGSGVLHKYLYLIFQEKWIAITSGNFSICKTHNLSTNMETS